MRTLIFTGTACQPILMSFWFSPTRALSLLQSDAEAIALAPEWGLYLGPSKAAS